VAARLPDAAGPSTTAPGVDSPPLAPTATSCDACGKSGGKLLRCGQCRSVWFCNRECQVLPKSQGHSGVNCRAADRTNRPPASAARSPFAAPSRPFAPTDEEELSRLKLRVGLSRFFHELLDEAKAAFMTNSRAGHLASVEKFNEAVWVADRIGGKDGAILRAGTYCNLAGALSRWGDLAAAARAAYSSLRAARAAGSRTGLIRALAVCGAVAEKAPGEMAGAERESREQERLSGAPPSFGLDLSQERRIRLPTTPAALSRLGLAYHEAAVATCDAALAAAGGSDSPASEGILRVPLLHEEAQARGSLGLCLGNLGEEPQSLELMRQAVALLRLALQSAAPGVDALGAKRALATWLSNLASVLWDNTLHGAAPDQTVEAAACWREALELSEATDDVGLKQTVLTSLANISNRAGHSQPVGLSEAAAFRARLNTLNTQNGRSLDTSCAICLEPLEQPGGGADEDAASDGGRGAAYGTGDGLWSSVPLQLHLYLEAHAIEWGMPHLQEGDVMRYLCARSRARTGGVPFCLIYCCDTRSCVPVSLSGRGKVSSASACAYEY